MIPDPPDFGQVEPLVHTWASGERIVRVFGDNHLPASFNPGKRVAKARGRFHFFTDSAGKIVPVLYGSTLEDGAIAETIFHDVPLRGALRTVSESRLQSASLATLAPTRALRLAELYGFGLERFGVAPEELTSTPATEYPRTVPWAAALHRAFPTLDGLVWMSRRFNAASALILFGDRVKSTELQLVGGPLPLSFGPGRTIVDGAANRAGIIFVT